MALLALVLNLVALYFGKGKGIAIWFCGTIGLLALAILSGARHTPPTAAEMPIVAAGTVVAVVSIWIGQWKGLIAWLVGTACIIVASATGLL